MFDLFGYLKPYKPDLRIKEFDAYKSVYCTLCKKMGKHYGVLSRITLSYDCTFLCMLSLGLKKDCPDFKAGRCAVNPLKRCNLCINGEEDFRFSSAVSLIMTYHKIKDDIRDGKLLEKVKAYSCVPIVYKGYKKACKDYPELDDIVLRCMQKQCAVESDKHAGIDKSAEPTANMMSEILPLISDNDKQKVVLKQFGYFIGRWIYLIDAADDIEKDKKNDNFNPFLIFINNNEFDDREIKEYINSALNQTISCAINAYNLVEVNHFKNILDNIITRGISDTQKKVLFDDGGEIKND